MGTVLIGFLILILIVAPILFLLLSFGFMGTSFFFLRDVNKLTKKRKQQQVKVNNKPPRDLDND